jgi:segregation and condensation protein A
MEAAVKQEEEGIGDALLVVALEGFEGPIDLLLHLARDQKLDLAKISILKLAEQYLVFIEQARELRLEIAADYLVMAAWLAYLKSRLLLPKQERGQDEEPTGEELAAALAWQMRRLEAMQKAANDLMALPQKGVHVFGRGSEDGALETVVHHQPTATIYDLLAAYARIKKRTEKPAAMRFTPMELHSIEEAVERLRNMLGHMPDWTTLGSFLPRGLQGGVVGRSAIAATLIASLELAKQGLIEVRQDTGFGPIWLRRAELQSEGMSQ